MELLGLFLIAFLVVLFPKQGFKAIGLCLGAVALLTVAFFGVLLLTLPEKERQNAVFVAEWRAEQAQKVAKQQQEQALLDSVKMSDARIEAEHQDRMRQQEWENKRAEERRLDHWWGGVDVGTPLYVKPELVPTPTPPPVSKPIPTPTPKKPKTLYTSN